jgi:hypothetical protein
MTPKSLFSILQFGYAPLSSYDFEMLKNDPDVKAALQRAVIYIIAQRPLIQFVNIEIDNEARVLNFSLHRDDINENVECAFPFDENPELNFGNEVIIEFGSHTDDPKITHGIKFYNGNGDFLFWASPERFLYLASQELIKLYTNINPKEFMSFKVLYVGKCTDEHIFKRFEGHHALQRILIEERIINKLYDKSHEFVIIPLEFLDNREISVYGSDNIDELVDQIENPNKLIEQRKIALDVEKALIKCLDPRFNKEKFSNYPKSVDGLYNENLDKIVYQIRENILLNYDDGTFIGDIVLHRASFIGVSGSEAELFGIVKKA